MHDRDVLHSRPSLAEKLAHIYSLRTGERVALGFRKPYLDLLEKLGNPHLNLPPTIHVAGTNGKGSTISMMRAMLEASGYRVHVYTSPHLVRFNERIVLGGEEISDDYLETLLDALLELNDGADLTFFELTTAMAFKAFAENPADVLLLEVGVGGRLDCTNVIEPPLLSVITRIDMDHTEYLGDTLEKIAAEKAGIIKGRTPCVIAPQAAVVQAYFQTLETEVPLFYAQTEQASGYALGLQGAHQYQNAATALKAMDCIVDTFPVEEEARMRGLAQVQWRGRLQDITEMLEMPPHICVFLDGGHNKNAAQALAVWADAQENPVHLVCGMMPHKDEQGYLKILQPHCASVQYVRIEGESETVALTWKEALSALAQDPLPKNVLIAGSLYLVGDVLKSS